MAQYLPLLMMVILATLFALLSIIASKILGAIRPGSIVVMHVQSQTAQALPAILAGLRARHLLQSSLPDLFAAAGIH